MEPPDLIIKDFTKPESFRTQAPHLIERLPEGSTCSFSGQVAIEQGVFCFLHEVRMRCPGPGFKKPTQGGEL